MKEEKGQGEREEKNVEANDEKTDNSELRELKKYVKEEFEKMDRKVTNLQSESNKHETDIRFLKEIIENWEEKGNEGES